jgi:hypothetical protein
MASALKQQELLAKGIREVKPIELSWWQSTGIGSTGDELPMAMGKTTTNPGGLNALTEKEAIAKFKKVIITDTKKLKEKGFSDSQIAKINQNNQQNYPGIKPDESVYDWMQRTDNIPSPELKLAKQFLADPKTVDPDNVFLNGVFTDAATAKKISGYTPQELAAKVAEDQATLGKRQAEVASETARLATGDPLIPSDNITTPPMNISFKTGLNDAQKASIQKLATKPTDQWNDTDKANWNYATNGQALPGTSTTATPPVASSQFTQEQILGLNAAADRQAAGTANKTDLDNLAYAKSKGWTATGSSASPTPAPTTSPAPTTTVKDTSTFTDKQKQELEVAQGRINAGQGSITDQQNIDYAKSKGWVSTGTVPAASTAPTAGTGTGTTTTTPKTGTESAVAPDIAPEDKKWINDLYQKYFDRSATSSEIANWAKENPQALDQFLQKEQKTYGYVSLEQKKMQDKNLADALAIIDSANLPPGVKDMWKRVVSTYPSATDFKVDQIVNEFKKIKDETIDPYYKQLADVAINDLKTSMTSMDLQRQQELEVERFNAPEAIRQAQAGQEKAGMTFTGKGIEALGAQSAYAQQPSATVATPVQTPFGGVPNTFYEGNVNQANRLMATSSAARYAAQQQALGSQAEKMLGSAAVMKAIPGLTYAPSGVTDISATNVQNKVGAEAQTLQGIIKNWEESQKPYTNIQA